MNKIIIILGIPGSGKGTQAKKIAAQYHYAHISTGNLLRGLKDHAGMDDEYARAFADMEAGRLVSDSVIYRLAFEAIEHGLEEETGVVLDGAIRNAKQAREYQNFFERKGWGGEVMVIELALSDEEAKKRLLIRGEFARARKAVPGTEGVEAARDDDVEDVIDKRLKAQGNAALKPITDYYEHLGQLVRVDGSKSIDEVEADVAAAV